MQGQIVSKVGLQFLTPSVWQGVHSKKKLIKKASGYFIAISTESVVIRVFTFWAGYQMKRRCMYVVCNMVCSHHKAILSEKIDNLFGIVSLVGKVQRLGFSKFSDTDTDAQHVQTFLKSSKSDQHKKIYTSMLFLFSLCDIILLSQRTLKCNKNEKCQYFFSGSSSGTPYIKNSPKIDVAINDKCLKNFTTYGQHHHISKTCLQLSQLRLSAVSDNSKISIFLKCLTRVAMCQTQNW